MTARRVRVLLVDDSQSVRAVLRRFLSQAGDLEIVGEAADGAEAVQSTLALQPDAIVMDLEMPVLDGYTAIERIMRQRPTPIVVLSSRANRDMVRTAFEAMRRGALEVLPKPADTEEWRQLAATLPVILRGVAGELAARRAPAAEPAPPLPRSQFPVVHPTLLRWVAIGASTGGPVALRDLLAATPARPSATFLVVQHIAAGFEEGLADWLERETLLEVRLAADGEAPLPGCVRIAPAHHHLRLEPDGHLSLDGTTPPRRGHRPSADELLLSVAVAAPRESAGVLLTGLGADGVEGLAALRAAGGLTMVQDAATSAVFGMPRVALERGAAQIALPPAEIGRLLGRGWERSAR